MLTDDLTFYLFAIGFISLLNLMITSGLWLSFRTSKKRYLAIASSAAAVEVCRHTVDFFLGSNRDSFLLYITSSFLQFGSTIILSASLLFIFRNSLGKELLIFIGLILSLIAVTLFQIFIPLSPAIYLKYLYACPLIAATGFLCWRAWFTGSILSPSKIFLLVASGALLLIRITLPSLVIDNFYLLLYYMEYLSFSMVLIALIIYEIEYSNRKVRRLLDSRTQSEQDLQFIVDNSLDIILVADDAGLLRSWSTKAQEVFGYTKDHAVGKVNMDEMFENNFFDQEVGAVDEFHSRMKSIDGESFMVDVRLKKVLHKDSDYSIFVLRLIAEPG
jgi:PAS domain S-box-containing protein